MSYEGAIFLIVFMIAGVLGGLIWLLNYLVAKKLREVGENGDSDEEAHP